jgi:formylglycine-generating enzyme required for sulfatase activity
MARPPSSDYDLAPATDEPKEAGTPTRRPLLDDDMDDERNAPKRPTGPVKPLPRTFKSAPLTTAEAEAELAEESSVSRGSSTRPSKREREAARAKERSEDGEPEKVKMEATPELDTYDTRRKIRLTISAIAGGALILAIVYIFSSLGGGGGSAGEDADLYVIQSSQMMPPELAPAKKVGASKVPNVASPAPPAPELGTANATSPSFVPNPAPAAPTVPQIPAQTENQAASYASGVRPESVVAHQMLPPGFVAAADSSTDPAGWPLRIVCERDGSTMILVPPGIYLLGRNDGSIAESPAVRVELSGFYMDEHEVTVAQYDQYRIDAANRGEKVLPTPEDLAQVATTPEHPVVLVSSVDAMKYAKWVGKVLPSDAQWEAAARGVDARIHPWGAGPPSWGTRRAPRQIDPVGSFPEDTTPLGLQDLGGNAWEWTSDWYDPRYHDALARQPIANPTGVQSSPTSQKTVKGSSKTYETSYREGMRADVRLPCLGFRCVLPILETTRGMAGAAATAPSNLPVSQPTAPPVGSGDRNLVPF